MSEEKNMPVDGFFPSSLCVAVVQRSMRNERW